MSRSRAREARLRSGVLVAVAVVAASFLTAAPAKADAPSVVITSPTTGDTVSGSVTVDVTVTTDLVVTGVGISMFVVGSGRRTDSRAVAPGTDCTAGCHFSATFDTAETTVPTWTDNLTLGDGTLYIDALVSTSLAVSGSASEVTTTLDNGRPALTVPAVQDDQILGADQVLSTPLTVAANTRTQSPVDHVRWVVRGTAVDSSLPLGEPPQLVADVSTLSGGYYFAYVFVVDAAGVSSVPVRIPLVVDRMSFTITGPSALSSDSTELYVHPTWAGSPPSTWVSTVDAFLEDDSPAGHFDNFTGFLDPAGPVGIAVGRLDDTALPTGSHTVRLVVTDNHGIVRQQSLPVTISDPDTAAWAAGTPVVGVAGAVAVTITDPGGLFQDATLSADGTPVASLAAPDSNHPLFAPITVSGPWTPSTTGTHTLSVTVHHYVTGTAYTFSTPVLVRLPSVLTMRASSTVARYGSRIAFTGALRTTTGAAIAGATVSLQAKVAGASSWVTKATGVTSSTGSVALSAVPSGVALWRLVSAPTATQGPAASPAATVLVAAAFGTLPAASSLTHGTSRSWSVSTAPYERGLRLYVQYRYAGGSWRTLTTVPVASTGRAVVTMRFASRGTYQLRLVRPRTTRIVQTISGAWTIYSR